MKKQICILALLLLQISNKGYAQLLITTVAGTGTAGYSGDGGPASAAQIYGPNGTAVDAAGNLYIPDQSNHRVRKVDAATGIITTIAGTGVPGYSGDGGPASAAQLMSPKRIAIDAAGNLLIVDYSCGVIRKISPAGIISTFAGTGTTGYSGDGGPATMAQLAGPWGIAVDAIGNVYISDANRIRKVNATGTITTFAGTGTAGYSGDGGPATAAQINLPQEIVTDAAGNIFFADASNSRIRIINTAGIISTIAGTGTAGYGGDGGPATAAQLNGPEGLARDATGSFYIAEFFNNRIRKIDGSGIITTISGVGTSGFSGDGALATAAQLFHPSGVTAYHNSLYIVDAGNYRIRKIFPDHLPRFIGGDTLHRAVCTEIITIDTLLAVQDTDAAQTMTWSVVIPPTHGVLSVSYTTTSTGGTLLPSPTSYSPMAGYVGPDTFKVSVTDGFAADTITVYLQVGCPDAVQSINTNPNGVNVYPNPSTGKFTVSFNSATHNEATVTITDAVGRVARRLTIAANSTTTIDVDIPGVYFVKCILPDGQMTTQKLIVSGNE